MATTTNYGWTTPDDTSLVKDGAAAIRTLGSSVDTTTKALNPSTTLGDIEYRSSTANTNTRLPIGTSGQFLGVVGGVPAWASPSASTNFTVLNGAGTSLSGSTTTISGLSGYNELAIFINGLSIDLSNDIGIRIRFNSDSSSIYTYTVTGHAGATNAVSEAIHNTTAWFLGVNNAAANTSECIVRLSGCNSSGIKFGNYTFAGNSNGTWNKYFNGNARYTGSSVISSVSISCDSGSFDAGTVFVYGA
jgi:hypothetical protein